ncbi:MAG: hypothetical protein JSR17_06770, partial [Proteobacteria bacterium]|nr:hypothetical protein [Pseudomonadota bacterium]
VVADALAQNPAQEPAEDYSFKNMAGKLLGLLPFGKKAPAVVQDKPAADLSTIVGEAIAQKPAHDQANTAPAIKPAAPAVDLTSVVADAVVQKSAPAVDLTTVVADAVAQQSSQEQVKNDKLVDDVAAAILAVDHPDAKKVNDVADLITATVTSEPAPAVVLPPPPPPPPMVAPTSAANGEKKKWDAVQVGDVSASGKKDASVAAKAPNVKQQPADLLAAITKGTALKKTGLDAAGELHQPKQFSERTSGSGSDKGILGKLADAMGEKISQKPTRSGLVEILANAIAGSKKSVATSQVQVEEEESDFDKEARLEALKDSNKAAIQNLAADKAVTDDVKLGLIEAGTKATSTMMSEIQRVSDLYANKLKAAIPAADQAPLQGKVQELSEKAFLAISQQLSQHAAKTAGMLYQDALARGLQKQFTLDQEIPPAAMATALDKLTKGTDLFDYVETSLRNSMQQILAEETKSLTDANKDRVHELHLDAAVENLNKALSADISVIRKEVSALHPQEVKAAFKASSAVVGIDMAAIMAERRKGIDGADKKADTDTDDSKPAVKKADSLVTKVADAIVSDNHDQDGASKKLDKSVHSSSTSESDTSSVGSFHTPVASPVGSVLGTKDSKPVDDKHSVTPDSLADLIVQESPIFAEPAQTQQTGGGIFGGLANLAHQGLDFGKNLFGGFFGGAKPEPVTLQGVVQQADEIPGLENSAKPDSGKPLSASGLVDLVADTVVSGALLGANPASNPTSAKPLSDSGVVDLVANAVVSGALLQPPHVEQTHVDAHL